MSLLDKGTYWVTPARLKNYFEKFVFRRKKEDINSLQIADLIAYPVTRHILDPDGANLSLQECSAESVADLLAIYRSRCGATGGR